MNTKESFAYKLKQIFIILIVMFAVFFACAIIGVLGIGNRAVNVVFGLILPVVAAFVLRKIYRTLKKELLMPILDMRTKVEEIAKGNLNVQIIYESNNELGDLASSLRKEIAFLKLIVQDLTYELSEFGKGNFNVESEHLDAYVGDFRVLQDGVVELVQGFSGAMGNIDATAEHVSMRANELADSSQSLAQGATEQAAVVEELLATVSEVTNQVVENTKMTEQAHDNAHVINEQAQISKQKMNELTNAMENIKETAGEIEKIIVDIEEIASQTNLLALNAAIEAARAGEAGRGFAVVADQIRKLAEDSANSAVTTKQLIIKSISEVRNGNEITEDTAVALDRVMSEMDKMVAAVAGIRVASDKQAVSVQEIENSVEHISGVIQNNSAAAQETSATSEELSAQAVSLKELVSQFRLRNI